MSATVVVVFTLLLGGAVWFSQGALPGDALYGLKRTSENVEVAFADNDVERAYDYLGFASTRVEEAHALLARTSASAAGISADSGVSAETARLVKSTLGAADHDLTTGAALLGQQVVATRSAAPIANMLPWAVGQKASLHALAAAAADPGVRAQANRSERLVTRAWIRATALTAKADCACLHSNGSDKFGPKPCDVCPTATRKHRTATPGSSKRTTAPRVAVPPTQAPASHGRSNAVVPGQVPGAGTPRSSTPRSSTPRSSLLPSLAPLKLPLGPTLQIPVMSTCSTSASVGPIVIDVDTCHR